MPAPVGEKFAIWISGLHFLSDLSLVAFGRVY
jgi:hypothetical protein